jgi:aryl-alcohol dehydrogenase-like predicted oxidoreductase
MEQRSLGDSKLLVSRMGLGLAALGRPGYINLGHASDLEKDYSVEGMQLRAHSVLDEAWELGVRYFDAARSYGLAESFLGSWLQSRSADGVSVGSKWGYRYTADWQVAAEKHEIKEHSLPMLNQQVDESRSLLSDRIGLYQIHSATQESRVLKNSPVLSRLRELKETGCAIGLSVSGPRQADTIMEALGVLVDGERLFDSVQATWNLFERSAGKALAQAHESGVGVIVKEGLANGRLTERNRETEFLSKGRSLTELARSKGVGIDALALATVLAQPWVDTVLSGASTAEQLRSNARALDVVVEDEMLLAVKDLEESSEDYWGKRTELSWN